MAIPAPLNARLDALVARANDAGERTSRKEVLGALLLQAPEDARDLLNAIRRYRLANARDAAPPGENLDQFLSGRDRRPGPRPRRPKDLPG